MKQRVVRAPIRVPRSDLEESRGRLLWEKGFSVHEHKAEIRIGLWLWRRFGGELCFLAEKNEDKKKTADYCWRNKLWELKSVSTHKAANSAIRAGLHQIEENPGGIILDYGDLKFDIQQVTKVVNRRMAWYINRSVTIMVVSKEQPAVILEYR